MSERRVLLVTGASSDLGCALIAARAGAEPDLRIVGHCHSGSSRLEALRDKRPELAGMEIVQADFVRSEGAFTLVEWLRAREILPNQFVHLPALRMHYERAARVDVDRFDADWSVQVRSLMILARAFLPAMAARCKRDGRIPNGKLVCVCSSVVYGIPPAYTVAYTTCKYGQVGLIKTLAAEYAGQRINLNLVSPSMIATQFLSELPGKAVEVAATQHPMGRHATPKDVIPTIEHLLSTASDFLTGVNIPITGGARGG